MQNRFELDRVGTSIVDAAFVVHSSLGPGLLETAYQLCLTHELRRRGLSVQCEITMPVRYGSVALDAGYRVDMIVEGAVLVENKAFQAVSPIHFAQVLTYLKLSDLRLGFLINWNVPRIQSGIKRIVNQF